MTPPIAIHIERIHSQKVDPERETKQTSKRVDSLSHPQAHSLFGILTRKETETEEEREREREREAGGEL